MHVDSFIAADRCTTYSEKEMSLARKNRVWKSLYIRVQCYSVKRNRGNRPDECCSERAGRNKLTLLPIVKFSIPIKYSIIFHSKGGNKQGKLLVRFFFFLEIDRYKQTILAQILTLIIQLHLVEYK